MVGHIVIQPVTLWYKFTTTHYGDTAYTFSHLEVGQFERNFPVPKFPNQNGWRKEAWRKKHAILAGSMVVEKTDFLDA